ncbi:polo like kinase SAK [Cotesia typhae]|uniref:polo like kinase SAK n=1 Tax=Cotesia typhae TaxID=2053667 RepID=UPI003D69BDF6
MPPMSEGFGDRIEDYTELGFLGRGGFGDVYKARCLNTGIDVAIKKINIKLMQDHGMIGRVREEVAIHSKLRHPSILKFYTSFKDAKFVYIVLELCPYGDLQRFLKKHYVQKLSENEAGRIIKQVAEGLLYLHDRNMVHRDISPSNLLLTADMQVKIADFGLAKLMKPNQNNMTMCGTPNYIAPEVATKSSHGPKADLWSLGCLLYTLLVGKAPFDSGGVRSTLALIAKGYYTLPSYLSDCAKDLISRLLQKEPHHRIELRDILKHPFITSIEKKYQEKMLMSRALSRDRMADSGLGKTMSSVDRMVRGRSRSEERASLLPSTYNPLTPHFTVRSDPVINRNNCQNNLAYQNKRNDYSHEHTSVRSGIPPSRSRIFSRTSHTSVDDINYQRNDKQKYREQAVGYLKDQDVNVKLQTPPLNSKRLLPTRHRTKNVILTILDNGEVCLEFIKRKNNNMERIGEVCRISSDGLQIILYKLRESREIDDKPPSLPVHGADIYSYENLPSRHHRKYVYAARFVNVVKAKTPKITLYNERAKIHYMENGPRPDCEAHFYNGIKVTCVDNIIKITDLVGNSYREGEIPDELEEFYEHYKKCYQRCLCLEASLTSLESTTEESYFPVIIGRKPLSAGNFSSLQGKENVLRVINSPQTINNSPVMPSFDYSVMSGVTLKSKRTTSNRSIQYDYKKEYIPGIGNGIQLPNGDIKIEYDDGSTLTVFPKSQGNEILYERNNGMISKYSTNQHKKFQIPYEVQKKLRRDLPEVISHFVQSSHRNIR